MSMFRSVMVALSILLAGAAAASAQAPSALPSGMTQEQFDSLVEAISNSVTEKLKAEGVPAAPAAAPAATPKSGKGAAAKPKIVRTEIADAPDEFAVFLEQAERVAGAVPVLDTHLAAIPGLLDQRANGGRGTAEFLALLGFAAVVAVAAEAMLRR